MSNVLFVTSEAQPLIKTGGLADVSGALPVALNQLNCNVRLMLPGYRDVLDKLDNPETIAELQIPGLPGTIELIEDTLPTASTSAPGVKVMLVKYASAFDRPGNPYLDETGEPWSDNAERFALLARAAVLVALGKAGLKWQPDVVHCHDWQSGLIPALLYTEPNRPATVFTIHNLAYQGLFPQQTFNSLALPNHLWSPNALEFHGQLSFIKGGIVFADRVTTVSPQYAREIQTPEFGCGLEGLLQHRQSVSNGILNGIDIDEWNPETDPHIAKHYSASSLAFKKVNKTALQKTFNLPQDKKTLLLGFIGRLVEQKGVDLIIEVMQRCIGLPIQFAILGSGDKKLEATLKAIASETPEQVGVYIGYNESLAHQVEAGIDAFLMPSRFEPCGLNQLYSLRYGSIPIVSNVGGLSDSVIEINGDKKEDGGKSQKKKTTSKVSQNMNATGFKLPDVSADALYEAIQLACELYKKPTSWNRIVRNGMNQSFSWNDSAKEYLKLYKLALQQRNQGLPKIPLP